MEDESQAKPKVRRERPQKNNTVGMRLKETVKKKENELIHDPYIYSWIIFAISIIAMTLYFKAYIKEMINISILFLIFWVVEPLILGVSGTTVTTLLGRGKTVSNWKRFPLFFIAVIMVYVLYSSVEELLGMAYLEEHVNFVFVMTWLGMLFLLWIYKFSNNLLK